MRTFRICALFAGSVLISVAALATTAFAQRESGAAEVALNFAKAVVARDLGTAATYVTDSSRADFLALMDLGDRLTKARGDLQAAIDQKFEDARTRGFRLDAPTNVVLTAEVAAQREVSPTLIELDMRLYTTRRTTPTQTVTWRAVQAGGTWKIELPQCASPEIAAPLKHRFQTVLDAHLAITGAISKGEFANAVDARAALFAAQRRAIPTQPR
jgi:hypothetical protein